MSNINEIKRSLKIYKSKKKISILHCVSNYPASIKNQNLNAIKLMKNKLLSLPSPDKTTREYGVCSEDWRGMLMEFGGHLGVL